MYNVYKDGFKVGTITDKQYLFTDLEPNTGYNLGVSRVVDGVESEIVTVSATTDKEVEPPHSLSVIDKSDTTITVEWDSQEDIGVGMYNLYLDNVMYKQNLQQRQLKIIGLQPSTEYKICICGIKADGTETPKVTVYETTNVEVVEGEPEVNYPLVNKLNDGSFEDYTGGIPIGWNEMQGDPHQLIADTEFKTHGDQSLKVAFEPHATEFYGASVVLQKKLELESGYYVTVLDYKLPESRFIDGKEKYAFTIYSLGSENHREIYGGEGTTYSVGHITDSSNQFINVYFYDYAPINNPLVASIDSVRVYKIDEEMYNYLDKGKMPIERIKSIFPFQEVATVETLSSDVSDYHIGGGYYELPNGDKVRGKDNAIAELGNLLDE